MMSDRENEEYNKKTSYIVAIDLGTTKVVTIVGEEMPSGYLRILDFSEMPSEGIKYGEVENISKVQKIIENTLNNIKQRLKIEISEIFVGIAGQHVRYTETSAEKQRRKYDTVISQEELLSLKNDVKNMLLPPGEEILHVLPRCYTIDSENGITDAEGRLGHKITGHFSLIIGLASSVRCTRMCMTNLQLSLKKLVLEPIASAKAVLSSDEMEMGVVMIDMGGGTTDLVVIVNNIVQYAAVIPSAGNHITSDIQQGFEILRPQAENLKVNYGSCISSIAPRNTRISIAGIAGRDNKQISVHTLAEVIESRVCMIVNEIEKQIAPYKEALTKGVGIVFTGGSAQLKDLSKYIKLRTGLDVRIGKPQRISSDSPQVIVQPKYSTVVGLLMYAADREESLIMEHSVDEFFSSNKDAKTEVPVQKQEDEPKPKRKNIALEAVKKFFVHLEEHEEDV